ncbi:MAG: DNA polymerase subunit beta [Alphaproteobacteria bacterium]|nr:DNA polymerase subunit beta [Alphaproteobacteria bacterium]
MAVKLSYPPEKLSALCRHWQVDELAIFGSVARGEMRPESDVDILVTFDDRASWSLLDLMGFKEELEQIFGRPVDLLEQRAIRNPHRRAAILRDKHVLHAER